ncbi:DUF2304 domain-containing protein [Falsarthrobacter nasiphocae]|uniref:DUF2304 domain-containing protein n=1 Tax=Falsarthrobacter nasiphocae TaxID=189863 RepID=A0AAE3YGK4_9MICC|nr:DUF2304 domain-containing protein [Falsarthrobacter nasiphocae]MDR6891406.1 hypothetical protein [Falsarthrobacter nasiphocae]
MQIVVQILLVLGVIFLSFVLMRGSANARHMAVRRMMTMFFALAAIVSIFWPALLQRIANLVGVGRGTDLVLYAFIVTLLIFMATTYQRFRVQEVALTKLARTIALKEADKPWLNERA